MALEYFLYTTDYNNTLVDRSNTTFSPTPPYEQIYIDFLIPETQPLYLYKATGGTIVLNDEDTINAYLEGIAPPPKEGDSVDYGVYTGYTATTETEISFLSGVTDNNSAAITINAGNITGNTAYIDLVSGNTVNNGAAITINAGNISGNTIDIADKVVWKNVWTGGTYQKNEMVRSTTWTMIANKETSDVAPPQAVGPEHYLYYPLTPSGTTTNAKQIVFGMQYTSPAPFWVNGYRINVVAGNFYEILMVQDPDGVNEAIFINSFTAEVTGWREFTLQPRPFQSGRTNQLLAIVHEPDPTPIEINANYDYQKPNNWVVPAIGQAIHATKNVDIISFNDLDDDGSDRSGLLLGLDAGDYITVGTTRWAVQTVSNEGLYIDITVAPARQAFVSGVQEFTFETVATSTLSYGEDVDYWSGNTNIRGVFGADIGWDDAVTNDNQYGVDILVQDAYISPDWDFVSSQGSNSGSASSGSAVWGYIGGEINDQPDLQNQFGTKVNLSGDTMTGSLSTSGNLTAVGAVTGSSVSVGSCLCSLGTTQLDGGVTAASFLNVSGVTTLDTNIYWNNPNTGGTLNDYGVKWDPVSKQLRTISTTGSSANVYCYASSAVTVNNATTTNASYIDKTWTLSEGYYESEFNAVFGNTSANRCATVCFLVNGVIVGSPNLMKTNDGNVRTTAYITQNGNLSGGTHQVQIVFRELGGGISQVHYGAMRIQKIGETI